MASDMAGGLAVGAAIVPRQAEEVVKFNFALTDAEGVLEIQHDVGAIGRDRRDPERSYSDIVDAFYRDLKAFTQNEPDAAAEAFGLMATGDENARGTAAVLIHHLTATNSERGMPLWATLLADPNGRSEPTPRNPLRNLHGEY